MVRRLGVCGGTVAAAVVLVSTPLLAPAAAFAQDLEPRAYANLPIGLNFVLAGYGYSTGGLAIDPTLPITDANLRVHTAVAAYARSLSVLGMSAKVDAVVPYSWLSGEATVVGQPRERTVSGFNDPRFRFTLNFYGAPVLSMEDFARYEQDIIVGASVQISAPLGQYDSSRLIKSRHQPMVHQAGAGRLQGLGPADAGARAQRDALHQERRLLRGHGA